MSFDKDKYVGYVEMALGIGDMMGPFIGGVAYEHTGFVGSFITFGVIILLGLIFSAIMIPNTFNKTEKERQEDDFLTSAFLSSKTLLLYEKLTYKIFFQNY
jgi:MFS family permease